MYALFCTNSPLTLTTSAWHRCRHKYAGMYVPCQYSHSSNVLRRFPDSRIDIANYIYNNPDLLDWNLKGFWINNRMRPRLHRQSRLYSDRSHDLAEISDFVVQMEIPAVDFMHKYENVFAFKCVLPLCAFRPNLPFNPFSQTFKTYLDNKASSCGYTDYLSTYLKYPPDGPFPMPVFSSDCDTWLDMFDAALLVNPAFNQYRILDTVSSVSSDSDMILQWHAT